MAQVDVVDYEKMPTYAKQIRSYGQSLNAEITAAYKSIVQLHDYWYGVRYGKLLNSFINMVPDINKILKLVVSDIPDSLEQIASNYSLVDSGKKIALNPASPKLVSTTMAVPKDVGMRYKSDKVSEIKSTISSNFKNAIKKMEDISTSYSRITWKSTSSDAFGKEFAKLKNNIVSSFNSINKEFTTLMNAAEADMKAAEANNTIK